MKKNLILLQENSGRVDFLNSISDKSVRNLVQTTIDGLAENFESIKTTLQLRGYYDEIINLTNRNCTKAKLLETMIEQSRNGNVFDLLVLGHGSPNKLHLHGEDMTASDIRNMLTQAQSRHTNFKFNLRLVYMCNCFSGTLLDDWLHIGAKVALGCDNVNYMPEPQTTYFFDDFVKKNYTVTEANRRSYETSNSIWNLVGLSQSCRTSSKLRVSGNGSLKFEGRRLTVGESIKRNIYASTAHNFTSILMIAGEKYKFTVERNDKWKNGDKETNANGYPKGFGDIPRQPSYNMMKLVGEVFSDNLNNLSYTGIHFGIGTSKTWNVSLTGFLVCHANDNLIWYGDNSGKVEVTVKRIS